MWRDSLSPVTWQVLVAYAVISVVTFLVYAVDKSLAGGRRRVSENALHVLALAGGWPGALLAIWALRHKRRRASFVLIVGAIALTHVAVWAWCARHA